MPWRGQLLAGCAQGSDGVGGVHACPVRTSTEAALKVPWSAPRSFQAHEPNRLHISQERRMAFMLGQYEPESAEAEPTGARHRSQPLRRPLPQSA